MIERLSLAGFSKLFAAVIYHCLKYARVFVPYKAFSAWLCLCLMSGAYPRVEHITQVGSGLTRKQIERLERFPWDKHTNLL
jgi:hypothetical protein